MAPGLGVSGGRVGPIGKADRTGRQRTSRRRGSGAGRPASHPLLWCHNSIPSLAQKGSSPAGGDSGIPDIRSDDPMRCLPSPPRRLALPYRPVPLLPGPMPGVLLGHEPKARERPPLIPQPTALVRLADLATASLAETKTASETDLLAAILAETVADDASVPTLLRTARRWHRTLKKNQVDAAEAACRVGQLLLRAKDTANCLPRKRQRWSNGLKRITSRNPNQSGRKRPPNERAPNDATGRINKPCFLGQ